MNANPKPDPPTSQARGAAAPEAARRLRVGLAAALVCVLAGAGALWWVDNQAGANDATRSPQRAAVAVRTAAAKQETLELNARYTGELDADVAEIAARVSGLLQTVSVRIGDRVKEGDVLASVDTAQLVRQLAEVKAQQRSAEASGERVAAELTSARSELARTEPLLADKLVSAQEVDGLRARVAVLQAEGAAAEAQAQEAQARHALLQQQIRDARLVAPFDGAVAERHLDGGSVVQLGTPVLRLVREGPLRVRFRVPERDVARIRKGLPFALTTQATGTQRFEGHVERIAAAISREDRSAAIEGALSDDASVLRAGMYAQIDVQLGTLDAVITVPGQAVLERPGADGRLQTGVFVIGDGAARWTPARVVGRAGERVAVEGIAVGTQIITVGQERVRQGTSVRAVRDTP